MHSGIEGCRVAQGVLVQTGIGFICVALGFRQFGMDDPEER
jgi:hypothetical protein